MSSVFKIILLAFCLLHSAYADIHFLTISDIHYGSKNSSLDGEDTGPELLQSTMDKYKKLSKNIDFILYLGDLPTHSWINSPKKGEYEKIVFGSLYINDMKQKPIFYIPGNNDSLSGNYQPFESDGVSPLKYATDWDGACAHCKGLIIDKNHMYHDGYYSSYVIPGNRNIILIALNATQWTKIPLFSRYPNQEKDALEQLSWLKYQLKKHRAKQLLIAMHEPPGDSYLGKPIWHERYLQEFISILNKNKKSYGEITLLTSHTHMDELRKIEFKNGRNIYAYSTPGISRIHHNYPGMKVFDLNKELKIQNFTTYYTNRPDKWQNLHYQALNAPSSIFPHCHNEILAQCLNQLSTEQVCDRLDQGLFYGVKSPTVLNKGCLQTYKIN